MKYHTDGSKPRGAEVWVFGSNLMGAHGKGAALVAALQFGAMRGRCNGRTGWSYAIPTKGFDLETLPLVEIKLSVDAFLDYARQNPDTHFFVTRIGCGLAGYHDSEIAPMFRGAPENCSFARPWSPYLEDADASV